MKVSTFRQLMSEQANAAVLVSGAHHSSWNKNKRFGPPIAAQSDLGGTANWDNSISYNPRHVDDRLQEMFRNARVHNQDRADLRGYRDAMRIVLHENVHLLASEGREHSQAQAAFGQPGVRPLEEAVTEIYSHERLNDYIDELGVDQVAPGIKDVKSPQVYQEFVPAAEGFADTIQRRSGVERDELIGRMAVVPADQKFKVAAEAMYDNSELSKVMPPDARDEAVGRIAGARAPAFGKVAGLPEKADKSERRIAGAKAAGEGYMVVSQLKKEWRAPAAGQRVERGVGSEQQRAGEPGRGEGAGKQNGGVGTPPSAGAPGLPPDIAAALGLGWVGRGRWDRRADLRPISRVRGGVDAAFPLSNGKGLNPSADWRGQHSRKPAHSRRQNCCSAPNQRTLCTVSVRKRPRRTDLMHKVAAEPGEGRRRPGRRLSADPGARGARALCAPHPCRDGCGVRISCTR